MAKDNELTASDAVLKLSIIAALWALTALALMAMRWLSIH